MLDCTSPPGAPPVSNIHSADRGTVLGSPVGPPYFEASEAMKVPEQARRLCERLALVGDPHVQFVILRKCLTACRMSHLIRTMLPQHTDEACRAFDAILAAALESTLTTPLDERAFAQATLPVSLGGLGIQASSHRRPSPAPCAPSSVGARRCSHRQISSGFSRLIPS